MNMRVNGLVHIGTKSVFGEEVNRSLTHKLNHIEIASGILP